MAITEAQLDKPIDWKDSSLWPMLADMQGNILKGHGRDHTINHFLKFNGNPNKIKEMVRAIGAHVTTALRQFNETQAYKQLQRPGGTAVFFFLSVSGYAKLGLAPPPDPAFQARMRHRAQLHDPAPTQWDGQHRDEPDALLIVADDSDTKVANAAEMLIKDFPSAGITLIGRDVGRALRVGPKGPGLEHFGYLDGRSQPLMLVDEIEREAKGDGISEWDPSFGPGQLVLVKDPHGATPESFGSYLVYRKLEQNVRGFKTREQALADALDLKDVGNNQDRERAGAMVVGRFENGTPLVLSPNDRLPTPTNNFNYGIDPDGLKCPFQGHIRKSNPRGDTVRKFGASEESERSHLMARRGIPFGERAPGNVESDDLETKPTHGVGLLFMAYNQDIQRQFEFTQESWVNNENFVAPATGMDPIIGQSGNGHIPQKWREHYGEPASPEVPFDYANFVKMRGGEYFFAPSVGFLRTLH